MPAAVIHGRRKLFNRRSTAGETSFHGAIAPSASESSGLGHDQLGIERHSRPQPFAQRTGAVRAVEAERPRLQLLVADLAVGAGVQRC